MMKKPFFLFIGLIATVFLLPSNTSAQAQELEMLALDIEKLAQMKQTLHNMYNAYTTLETGYNKAKSVTSGNYHLHQVFLDGLYSVSPAVKNQVHVINIISDEAKILSEYKSAWSHFSSSGLFKTNELDYVLSVYNKIVAESISNIDALTLVLTTGQTRMSDDERITQIDHIYQDMEEKLRALRRFNKRTSGIIVQRSALQSAHSTMKTIIGITNK